MMTIDQSWKTWAGSLALATTLYSGGLLAAPANLDIVARVGDSVITRTQLEQAMVETLREQWEKQFEAQTEALDTLVRERLLELEATRQGVSVAAFKAQINAAAEPISAEQINALLRRADIDPQRASPRERDLARFFLDE